MSKRSAKVTMMAAAMLLAFGGHPRLAQAGAISQGLLEVTNFQVTFDPSQVQILSGSNDGNATALLSGFAPAVGGAVGGDITLVECAGGPCPAPGTNLTPPPTATFASSNAILSGIAVLPPGAQALTDNSVSLQSAGGGFATSKLGLNSRFQIVVNSGTATVGFQDLVRTYLISELDAGTPASANSLIGWSLTVAGAGGTFVFSPDGVVDAAGEIVDSCNQNTNTGVGPGTGPLTDTKSCSGAFQASLNLTAGVYQATITHTSSAQALVPAPGSLALLAGGLLGLGWVGRRRSSKS